MIIKNGTVWHTYTTKSFKYKDADKVATLLIKTGIFSGILTNEGRFTYLAGESPQSVKLDMNYHNNGQAIKVSGMQPVHASVNCVLTKASLLNCINIRLSEHKLFYIDDIPFSENIILCAKPVIIKTESKDITLHPIVRLYKIGLSQVTLVDFEEHNLELKTFFRDIIDLPFQLNDSIKTSIDFAIASLKLDYSGFPLTSKILEKRKLNNYIRKLQSAAYKMKSLEGDSQGYYVDYGKALGIRNNLSDISRYIVAIINSKLYKKTIKNPMKGMDLSKFYGAWYGKPSIFIFEHEKQMSDALKNHDKNKKLISALINKNYHLINEGKVKNYIDHRAFNDFNFFCEQSATLTLASGKVTKEGITQTYTPKNMMWDNQIKSELRDFIAYFYDSTINEIKNERSHIGLAEIQEEVIRFEEWLRIFSRKYGEIQEFAFRLNESADIQKMRHNLTTMLKARMLVIKLKEANISENSNKKITMAFGMLATTSLSPIIKPLFDTFGLTPYIKKYNLSSYNEIFYFIGAVFIVFILIKLINRSK
ncbi:hypothetical protein NMY27_16080 [Cronobacter dublinensis subsp. beijingensis]|uniref:hypothetical protein n=1 Tax=Cronobacter dublinensis TaxID=413497 RepID=UPI0023DA5EAB|nr:hypothetical protein [Cronobacter dublinensis]WEP48713.1 hypothetical protein NMY27_16080 [Cronobacter dublinensis]